MNQTDPLLQPFQLKHLRLKNRILSTSHEPAYAEDGKPKLRYQLYHEEKAKGGLALTMFGGSSNVAPDSPAVFGQLYVGDDSIIPYFQQMRERVHRHGAALMCQITHMGRRTVWNAGNWLPTVAPSILREHAHRAIPKEMETFDIERIVKSYGAAARRCKEGGLDGVEIEAYGHLLDSFWTPAVNSRTDKYGGSLENRMRFSMEVLEEIRKQVGDEYIVGIRMSGDEMWDKGLTHKDCLEIGKILVATGMLDFVSLIKGHIASDEALSHVIPNMGTPSAPHIETVAAMKAEMDIPIFHAGRIADVATARYAVREGIVDMIGMTRAHLADPHIVNKIMRGEEEQIRPCVGVGYCIDRIYTAGEALCMHNAATGREETMPHTIIETAGERRKIVIIGAGPAGLEAARVSAERGHDVVVFEASDRAGGQIQLAARVGRRRDIIGITDWLSSEIVRLGVDIRFNSYAEAQDVLAEEPDVVIVATGGQPNTSFLENGNDLIVSSWDILSGYARPADHVLLFDEMGQHQGASCAEFIALAGSKLELVSPDRVIGQEIGGTNYPAYLRTFYEHDVKMTLNYRLTSVRREGKKRVARLFNEYSKSYIERTVDQVVVEYGTLPVEELYLDLKADSLNQGEVDLNALLADQPQTLVRNPAGSYQLYRIGDAVSSRNIHAAIYEALRLCKEL